MVRVVVWLQVCFVVRSTFIITHYLVMNTRSCDLSGRLFCLCWIEHATNKNKERWPTWNIKASSILLMYMSLSSGYQNTVIIWPDPPRWKHGCQINSNPCHQIRPDWWFSLHFPQHLIRHDHRLHTPHGRSCH